MSDGADSGVEHSLCVACIPGQRAAPRWAAHWSGLRAVRGVGCAGAGARAAQEAGPPVGQGAGTRPRWPRPGQRTSRQEATPEPAGGHGAAAGGCLQGAGREGWAGRHLAARPWEEEAGQRAGRGGAVTPPNST